MKPTVYLADLRYNYGGVLSADCTPLGVAYMKAVMDQDLPEVESHLFAYPDNLLEAMREKPPDVLMVSNYSWNQEVSVHFGTIAKRLRPDTLVVQGGPNIYVEPEQQKVYLETYPQLDAYALGEGDYLATDLVRRFLDAGMSIHKMGEQEIPSCVYRRPDGQVVRCSDAERTERLDDIPSPWLTGIQDEFFDGRLAPMIESNRGCPFKCTFCVQGGSYYTKVRYFSEERVKEELLYIARRIRERAPNMGTLRIADPNYGMYERDADLSSYMRELRDEYGWPTFIDATTGKNRPERIIESVEKADGIIELCYAVQSLDQNTLRNVKRQNIKVEAYEQLLSHMNTKGLRSHSQIILGLPGESLESHVTALSQLVDAGIDELQNFQLMLIKGTELETRETRKMFTFESRYRVLPKNFGIYDGDKVFDVEEIVVSTDTLPFEDYLTARKYHLLYVLFWNDSWFDNAFSFAKQFGLKASVCLEALMQGLDEDPVMSEFVGKFVKETAGELFDTKEECKAFYSRDENYKRMINGEIGDNLLYKYRAIASFHLWPETTGLAMNTFKRLLMDGGGMSHFQDFERFWQDFHTHTLLKHAHGREIDQILAPASARMQYDIPAWLADGNPKDPTPYRLEDEVTAEFRLSPASEKEFRSALELWTTHLRGLTKLVTRIRVAWQVRKCHLPTPAALLQAQAEQAAAGKLRGGV